MRKAPWFGPLLAVLPVACSESHAAHSLKLLEFRQQAFDSVALNEELLFFFSEELDPSSVTSETLQILDERGRGVAGERVVRGNALSFLPALPCAPDLSDGALRPGASYQVLLGGFPRLDGIRSARGRLLSECLRMGFRTADVGSPSPLFLDPFMGPYLMWPRGKRGYPVELEEGRIVLEYGEALDPSSVPRTRFELSRYLPGTSERVFIDVVPRLVQNNRTRALLVLEPIAPGGIVEPLPPDRYYLQMPGRELRTLGGRIVEPGWGSRVLELVVPRGRVELDFSQVERFVELPGGCDGTAIFTPGRGLGVRFPAAAGTGEAGKVELMEPPGAPDLQAVALLVPEPARIDLGGLEGPVVLRSQTSLSVRGRIERRGRGRGGDDPLTLELRRAEGLAPSQWGPLSEWVQRLLDPSRSWSHEPWTVLIAGGDLLVPEGGAVDVDGPLVLIAGGWIRVEGTVVTQGDLWKTFEGGGGVVSRGRNRRLPLVLDPPAVNPLRVPLTVGATSREVIWAAGREGWRSTLIGHEGGGSIRSGFLQTREGERTRLYEDPGGLQPGAVVGLLLLSIEAGRGEPWDPPRVEHLRTEAVTGPLDLR